MPEPPIEGQLTVFDALDERDEHQARVDIAVAALARGFVVAPLLINPRATDPSTTPDHV